MTLITKISIRSLITASLTATSFGPQLAGLRNFDIPTPTALVVRMPQDREPPKAPSPTQATCEVIHLGQAHAINGNPEPAFVSMVVKSQMNVANYLRKNKDTPIVLEGLTEHLTPELFEKIKNSKSQNMVGITKTIFPEGLPTELNKLSNLQREFLYEIGAAKTMWYLGEIKEVRRAIDPETSKKIDDEIIELGEKKYGKNWPRFVYADKELQSLIFERREEAALREVAELQGAGAKKVTVIFGQAHDFSPHADDKLKLTFKKVDTTEIQMPDKHTVKPFAAYKGDWSSAQVDYGNIPRNDPKIAASIAEEQKKVLTHLEDNKLTIKAWQWQHFTTPELCIQGLKFLDPKSVGTELFPLAAFQRLLDTDPKLQEAGKEWLKMHKK